MELEELLRMLNQKIDDLVQRNPIPEMAQEAKKSAREANVFDEIIYVLAVCRGLVRGIDDKVTAGISQKVQ